MRCAKSGQRVVILIDKNVKLILDNNIENSAVVLDKRV